MAKFPGAADVRVISNGVDAEFPGDCPAGNALDRRANRFDVEGFGLVYLEAAACGTPSLAGSYGGCVDAVESGVSGCFCPNESPDAIAGCLESYSREEIRFDPADVVAYARRHTWERQVAELVTLYREVLAAPKRLRRHP